MATPVYDDQDLKADDLQAMYNAPSATTSGSDIAKEKQAETAQEHYNKEFAGITGAENYGKDGEKPKSKTDSAADLKKAEDNAADTAPALAPEPPRRRRFWTKARARAAGGIAGAGVTGGVIGASMFSGPLEFIHVAQILHNAHFSAQESVSDSRTSKLIRYLRGDKRPGNTRLTTLGAKYHDKIIADLKKIGIEPTYAGKDHYTGFTLDTKAENSPYKDMTPEEARVKLEADTGVKSTIEGSKLIINTASYFKQQKSLKVLAKWMGGNGLASAARFRTLKKFGLVSLHPLHILDKAEDNLRDKIKDYLKKWQQRNSTGTESVDVDTSKAESQDTETDSNGNQTTTNTDEPGENVKTTDPESIKAKFKLGAAGGALSTVVGLVCALQALNKSVAIIRYANVILPLIRMGLNAITVGNQIMAGQDIDQSEVAALAQSFVSVSANGQMISNWNDAKPIRQWTGQQGGINTMSDVNGMFQSGGGISWLSWTNNGAVGTLCGGAVQTGITILSFGLSIFTGGVVSEVISNVVAPLVAGPLLDKAANLLAGKTVNVAATGAAWGGDVDYGATLGANTAALHSGGVALNPAEEVAETEETQQGLKDQFDNESFIARVFDIYDYQSLTGRLADMVTPSLSANIYSTLSVTTLASSILKLPITMLSSVVHADAPQYIYPFPTYDTPPGEVDDTDVDDPYANADKIGDLLDQNCWDVISQTTKTDCSFVKAAEQCFGDQVIKEAAGDGDPNTQDMVWDVIPDNDVDIYNTSGDGSYDAAGCRTGVDGIDSTTWKDFRFFILDTGVMTGYVCAQYQDPTSCQQNNSGSGNSALSPPSPTGGDAATLAKQVLNDTNVDLSCYSITVKQDVQDAANGAPGTGGKPIDARVFQLIEAVAKTHKVCVTAIESNGTGHTTGSAHYSGLAVDFGTLDGKSLTGRDTGSKTIISIAEQAISGGGSFGQSECGTATLTTGWTQFDDTCDHLHVQFPAATGTGTTN